MADNVAITAGSGTTISADDVGSGVLQQRVKVTWGPDGTGNDTDVASGKPLPVQLRTATGTATPLPALGTAGSASADVITVQGIASGTAQPASQSGTWTVQPGNTANTTPWLSKVSDGTNAAAIKAASTNPAATDPALVVALSPNGLNANGQTTSANSAPVVLSNDNVGTSGFMKKEDVASADGDAGIACMAIQQSSPADTAGTNGDYAMLQMSAGRLWSSSTAYGDVAHASADSGNPVKQGFKATTSLSGLTLAADANRTNGFAGVDGVQIVRPHCNLEDIVSGNATNTDGASTQCIAAQASGIKTYLTSIVLCNTSATAITVDIKDGTSVKISLPLPAGSGCVYNPPIPIPGTAATAWNFDGSAAATTVTCSMVGFKSKV